ncbi:MAG: histidine kinase [Lachnospiraceae bacterium]|nr:histidine kinase [Lachnospiraceae bacterium]
MNPESQTLIALNVALLLQLAGLAFAVVADPYVSRQQRKILIYIVVMDLLLIVQNQASEYITPDIPGAKMILVALSAVGYSLRPMVIALFIRLLRPAGRGLMIWGIVGFNALIHISAFFMPLAYSYNANLSYQRGPLGYTSFVVSFGLLIWMVYISIKDKKNSGLKEQVIPIFYALLVVAASLADLETGFNPYISYLMVAMVSGCVFFYIWLHLKYAREHEMALWAEQRMKIMISQIQPHFLYNTLATIQALCVIDPDRASEVTGNFAAYLRQNIDSLNSVELIPFEKELEHTKLYSDIEMIRFPSIKVQYDIGDINFTLPALTVQPMVENAIRHGIRVRDEGEVTVSVHKCEGGHEIVIRDNGVGFRMKDIAADGMSHIGIANVKQRIEQQCGGIFEVHSAIDEGTRIRMFIPEH